MTPTIAIDLVVFGLILLSASFGLFTAFPEVGTVTLLGAAAGGLFCVLWGFLAFGQRPVLWPARATVLLIALFVAVRTVLAWVEYFRGTAHRIEPVMCMVLLVFAVGLTASLMKRSRQ